MREAAYSTGVGYSGAEKCGGSAKGDVAVVNILMVP